MLPRPPCTFGNTFVISEGLTRGSRLIILVHSRRRAVDHRASDFGARSFALNRATRLAYSQPSASVTPAIFVIFQFVDQTHSELGTVISSIGLQGVIVAFIVKGHSAYGSQTFLRRFKISFSYTSMTQDSDIFQRHNKIRSVSFLCNPSKDRRKFQSRFHR